MASGKGVATYEGPKLSRFFLFNPLKFGLREENDTEKVLYFWPPEMPIGRQMSDVGLVEALANFSSYVKDAT